jgi:putative ABC transport system permease protein
MDEVQEAYPAFSVPLGFGVQSTSLYLYADGDTLTAWQYFFTPDSKMFEVFGIQSLTPGVPTSELSHNCAYQQSVIITRTLANFLFGTTDVAGRTLKASKAETVWNEEGGDYEVGWVEKHYDIRAVVEDVRMEPYDRDYSVVFLCESGPDYNVPIVARLRDGIDADWFVEARREEVQRQLVTDHFYVRDIQSARQAMTETIEGVGIGRQARRNLLIAAFFAVNVAFGVFGTLLMYTRQRREEAGVRRAFGATKWSVFWSFIREAWLLTTVSVVAGCAIYFQFATARGLYDYAGENNLTHYWFDDFGTHFMVVSLFVYLIILCTVLIATAIPAWRICRSTITEAIKEE